MSANELIERLADEEDLCRNDGADDIADLLADARTEIKRLREALEPFAQAASTMATWAEDHHRLSAYPGHTQGLTAGDLRRAHQALKGTGADHG